MKQISFTKSDIVRFFITQSSEDVKNSAKKFVNEFNLNKENFIQFQNITIGIGINDIQDIGEYSSPYEAFSKFQSFLIAIRRQLNVKIPDYNSMVSVKLQKLVNPPVKAYDFVGHNKLDIEDNKLAGGYIYY